MKKKRFSVEQITAVLQQAESGVPQYLMGRYTVSAQRGCLVSAEFHKPDGVQAGHARLDAVLTRVPPRTSPVRDPTSTEPG